MHKPIVIDNLALNFSHKKCFSKFTVNIHYRDKICIIGKNGVGKSTLLKIIQGLYQPSEGKIYISRDVVFGYIDQLHNEFEHLSGGQKLNYMLNTILLNNSNILLLDEP